MLNFVLNHSVSIVGLITALVLITLKVRSYMKKKALDGAQLASLLRQRFNELGEFLFSKIGAAIVLTTIISIVSFREIWVNDVFHIVFLTSILLDRIELYLNKLVQ